MKISEQELLQQYRQMDLDPQQVLQDKVYQQICAKKYSFKRKTVWGFSAACAAALAVMCVWLLQPAETPYLPDPAEFDRMNFAFYRELALPGQDLGISESELSSRSFPS